MNIILQQNNSEKNKAEKNLTTLGTLTGSLREGSSRTDPVILVESSELLSGATYITIPEFGRSYFIEDIVSQRNTLCEIHAHVDVLSTFWSNTRELDAVVSRQANRWNLYLDDGTFKTYQNDQVVCKSFPSGFSTLEFVMAVAGDN